MKFETDRGKRRARVAHRKRMKRLDKAKQCTNKKSDILDPDISAWNRKTRKSFLKRRKQREKKQRKFDKQKMRKSIKLTLIIAFVITVLYYAVIIRAWYEAPLYMAFGWGVEKLMTEGEKAEQRADKKYKKSETPDAEKREALKAHQKRMKRLDRIDRAKGIFTKKRLTVTSVIAFIILVLYYAMIVQAWYYAPVYMAFGWFVEWLKREGEKAE